MKVATAPTTSNTDNRSLDENEELSTMAWSGAWSLCLLACLLTAGSPLLRNFPRFSQNHSSKPSFFSSLLAPELKSYLIYKVYFHRFFQHLKYSPELSKAELKLIQGVPTSFGFKCYKYAWCGTTESRWAERSNCLRTFLEYWQCCWVIKFLLGHPVPNWWHLLYQKVLLDTKLKRARDARSAERKNCISYPAKKSCQ